MFLNVRDKQRVGELLSSLDLKLALTYFFSLGFPDGEDGGRSLMDRSWCALFLSGAEVSFSL